MDLSLWNSLDYLTLSCENWHTDFYLGYGREEDVLNEKACMQTLRILINKADGEIRELEEDIVMLQCHLAWDDEDWSKPCSAALQEKVEWLDTSIKSLNKGIMNDFCVELEEPVKVPPRLHDLVKPLLENYFQVKSSQKSTAKKLYIKNLKEKKSLNNLNTEGCFKNTSEEATTSLFKPSKAEIGSIMKEDIVSHQSIASPRKCANDKHAKDNINSLKTQLGKRLHNSASMKSEKRNPIKKLKEAKIEIPDPMVMVSSSNASIAKVGSREVDERRNADMDIIFKKKATKSQVTHPGKKTNSYEKSEEMETKFAERVKLADDILEPLLIPAQKVPHELSKMQKSTVFNPIVMVSNANASSAKVDSREVDERRSTDRDIISQKKATESRVTHQDKVVISSEEMETKVAEIVKFGDAISNSHFNPGKNVPEELINAQKRMVSNPMVLVSSANASIAIVGAREMEERRSTDIDIISKKKATESRVTHQDNVAISSEEMETKVVKTVKFADAISDFQFNPEKIVPEELISAQKMMVSNPMVLISSANASIAIVGAREIEDRRSTYMDIISKKKATESRDTHQDEVAISSEEMETKVAENVKFADIISNSHFNPGNNVPEELSYTKKIMVSNPMVLVPSAKASIAIVGSREIEESRSTNMDIISKKKATASRVTHQDKVAISTEEMNTIVVETVEPADAILDSHLVPAKEVPEQLSNTEKTRVSKHSTNENVVSRKPLVKQKGNQKNIAERTMALETRATETTEIDSDSLLASYKHKRKRESKPKKKMENNPLGQLTKVAKTVIINDVNTYHSFKLKGQEPKKTHELSQNIELESPSKESLKGLKKIEDLEEIMKKDAEKLTLRELKTIAKNRNLAGYSGLKKGELQKKLGLEPQEDLK